MLNCEFFDGQFGFFFCEIIVSWGVSYVDVLMGQRELIFLVVFVNFKVGRERKTYYYEVEFIVYRIDGFKDKCDFGYFFIFCVCYYRLWRFMEVEIKLVLEVRWCLLKSLDSSKGFVGGQD